MKIFDIFRKLVRRKDSGEIGSDIDIGQTESLPSDLERFKIRKGPITAPEPTMRQMEYEEPKEMEYDEPPAEVPEVEEEPKFEMQPRPRLPIVGPLPEKSREAKESDESEKLDIILQRLEMIDTRLKLIEERTRK